MYAVLLYVTTSVYKIVRPCEAEIHKRSEWWTLRTDKYRLCSMVRARRASVQTSDLVLSNTHGFMGSGLRNLKMYDDKNEQIFLGSEGICT